MNQTLVSRISGVRSVIELLVFGNPGESGLAALARWAHFVRLSALRALVELALRG